MKNIAHLLPYSASFPLKTHNGRYEWALRLAKIQAQQGHRVTVYSALDSKTNDPGIVWASHGDGFKDSTVNNLANIKTAYANLEHDIFHSHFDFLHYFAADQTTRPVVATLHWFPNDEVAKAAYYNKTRNVTSVPVTKFMANENSRLGIPSSEVIYHGIDTKMFEYFEGPRSDRFIFVGRIAPHKGVREAVEIAVAAGINLDIVGKINPVDQTYWNSIEPMVDGQKIKYLGAKPHTEIAGLMSRAKAMIFPSQILEAFGQTTVEAQACGTPVIIQDLGASNELVQHGVSGFVVKNREEYLAAIQNIGTIKPADCRAHAKKFDLKKMVATYETLYAQLLGT